jgi:hypothetical protein
VTRIPVLLLLALAASGLAGCGRHVYRATMPNTTLNCASGLDAVSSRPLTYLAPKEDALDRRMEFAEVADCVTLDGTALPVALYRLDAFEGPTEIDIRVLLSEGGTFAASAELLDAGFQPVKHHGFTDFVRRTNEYSLSVFVDPARPQAPRYLLLRPDAAVVGQDDRSITSQSSAFMMPGGGAYRFGKEVTRSRPLIGAGQLQVVAYRARRAAFEDDGKAR